MKAMKQARVAHGVHHHHLYLYRDLYTVISHGDIIFNTKNSVEG